MEGMERWEGMEWWEEMERLEETEKRGQGWVVGEAPLPRVADPLLDVDRGEGVLRTGAPHSCSTVAGAGRGRGSRGSWPQPGTCPLFLPVRMTFKGTSGSHILTSDDGSLQGLALEGSFERWECQRALRGHPVHSSASRWALGLGVWSEGSKKRKGTEGKAVGREEESQGEFP